MLCYAKATTGSLCNYLNKRRKSNGMFTRNISKTNALCLGFMLFSAFPNKYSLLDSQRGEGGKGKVRDEATNRRSEKTIISFPGGAKREKRRI